MDGGVRRVGWVIHPPYTCGGDTAGMSSYRRAAVPGAAYFFTVALADRRSRVRSSMLTPCAGPSPPPRASIRSGSTRWWSCPIICTQSGRCPRATPIFPVRWRKLKARFTRAVGGEWRRSDSKIAKGERGLWQRRYWEHMIRDGEDWWRHVEYCWFNPVKHGLVAAARDWPLSSFHREVRRGVVPADWCGKAAEGCFGE